MHLECADDSNNLRDGTAARTLKSLIVALSRAMDYYGSLNSFRILLSRGCARARFFPRRGIAEFN